MSIVYEVNIKISIDIVDEYLSWLNEHVSEILKIDGFQSAKLYKENIASLDFFALTIHYTVSSRNILKNYFSEHAEIMRQKGIDRFGDKFTTTRRILEEKS